MSAFHECRVFILITQRTLCNPSFHGCGVKCKPSTGSGVLIQLSLLKCNGG